ncbi:MAG: hypothetical protein K2M07_08595 [Muribaculaceae bacterium]|nr:hypothetical protein [Muribaculaceae bacterium]
MIKTIFSIICMLMSFCAIYAQNSVKFIDVRNDKIPILVDGEWEIMDHYKVLNLLEDNIYSFFGLHDKYHSALKKQMFEKTSEYSDVLLPKFHRIKENLKNTDYAILYYLYNNNNYNVDQRNFKFKISTISPDNLKLPNTFTFSNFYTTTVPNAAFELETGTSFGRPYEIRYFVTPTISEEIAVDVEDAMRIHPCPYYLLFVVNIQGLKEQRNSMGFDMPYILTKPKKIYLYNKDTEDVVVDMESVFTAPSPAPKVSPNPKGRTSTKTQKRTTIRK